MLLAPGLPSPVSISLLMLVTASTSASSSGTQVITLKPWYSFRSHFVGLKIANDVKTMHESKAAHKCTAITRYNIIWWKTIYIVDFCLASYSTLLGGSSIQRNLRREHGPSVRLGHPTLCPTCPCWCWCWWRGWRAGRGPRSINKTINTNKYSSL